jgi:hypothetical protein
MAISAKEFVKWYSINTQESILYTALYYTSKLKALRQHIFYHCIVAAGRS